MRKYHHIHLNNREITTDELEGEDVVRAGRYLIAKTLLENNVAEADPLGPDNILIFSAGPFAGTSFSNANRTSVGCKSPMTGGIKEANGGGTFSYALGQLYISGFNLYGISDDWVVIHMKKDGSITFDDATPYMGKGNFEAAEMLHAKYGKKVSLALCGPVGEYKGNLAGVSFSDKENRPARLAARGGVGAVMGSKRVKAVVVDTHKMPNFVDRKAVTRGVRSYSKMLQENPVVVNFFQKLGTMGMADYTNHIGGLPVRNFSAGTMETPEGEPFRMGGEYIAVMNTERGGEQTHACMPGCVIQCSNLYMDADGKEVVSPVEYETLGLLGTNCGISDPDDLAGLNYIANDLGIDTIETGAMLAVLMEAGLAEFGDVEFMTEALREVRLGTENGRIYAQGTGLAGKHFNVKRLPVIKNQAISAYDPRVIEVTGISMMTTAMGADHTAGNAARYQSLDKDADHLMDVSLAAQINMAMNDSLGLCIFGQGVTAPNLAFVVNTVNSAHGVDMTPDDFQQIGRDALQMEAEFNRRAGFTDADDDLPEFFYTEELAPTNQKARFRGADVHHIYEKLGTVPERLVGYGS
ncbi:MAG: aldehyde ferredoxin oxidoreductase C-terminal domain-containing protein [Candidatus Promineifilaceae bacterium]